MLKCPTCYKYSILNEPSRIVTGCLRPTPTDHLPILSGIQPAELCRLEVTLSLPYRGSLDSDHMLHGILNGPLNACQERLRYRHPFVPAARTSLSNLATKHRGFLVLRQFIKTTCDRNGIQSKRQLIEMTVDKKKVYFCMFLQSNYLFVTVNQIHKSRDHP